MAITAAQVKELREMTGAGMMDCKKALTSTDGDMDKAVEFLREKGLATAQKKASRTIYTLTNFTATPAAVASAMVTATFGIAEQAYQLKQGNVDEQRFIENSEMLCLDASVSALSSFAGQVLIPVPVLGAVIGNTVGTMMYQIAKDNLSAREQKIFEEYAEAARQLDLSLQNQYQKFVDEIGKDTKLFMELLNRAFEPDIRVAFEGSIDLAKSCGVPVDEILDSKEKIASFFMD